ncbi:MAG: hypothetical protein NVSMB19_01810 [Vulcanimicrobiaceae bacterium]
MHNRFARWRLKWTAAAVAVGIVLYVAALSNEFYALTSPTTLSWHVALRKAYSVVAFGALAYLVRRALVERGRRGVVVATIATLALFSAAIELGQWAVGSTEGFVWNAFDIACGAAGAVCALGDRLVARRGQARQRGSLRRSGSDLRK